MTDHSKPSMSPEPTSGENDLKEALSEAKSESQAALRKANAEAKATATTLRGKATEAWYDAYETASDHVSAAADDAAAHTEQQARSTWAAAQEQPAGSPQQEVLTRASAVLESTAEHLRGTDLDTALDDLRGFARRQPTMFLAGAAALGFFAARIARASPPEAEDERDFYTPSELNRGVS